MSERPLVLPCSVFHGRSPKTGKRVGSRHRWSGAWGEGRCIYCHHTLQEVLETPKGAPDGPPQGQP